MPAARDRQALVILIGALALANIARSTIVPDAAHFAFNLVTGGAAVAVGRWARVGRDEVGLARDAWRRGLAYGAAAAACVIVVLAAATIVPAADGALDDDRASIGAAELAARALVVIPIGTVLVEEVAFRGVLLGLALRLTSPVRAALLTAVTFGLWHVLPAWRADGAAVAAGALVATTAAGLVFGWLRTRSGSLLAPILAHLATNSGALGIAWLAR